MSSGRPLRVVDGGRPDAAPRRKAAAPIPVITPPSARWPWLVGAVIVSFLVHAGLVVVAILAPELVEETADQIVQMMVVETSPEPEVEPEVEPEPEPEPEREPEPEVVDYQDAVVMEDPPATDSAPTTDEPPPPVFGVSMSSTVATGGNWKLSVGNTVGIRPEDSADVDEVEPLDTPVVAYQQIEREPVVIKRFEPAYPDGPKADGIEGDVLLYLTIDENGNVTEATVIRGPHPELNETARQAMFKHRFRPATKGGRNVVVRKFPYTFTWIIEE